MGTGNPAICQKLGSGGAGLVSCTLRYQDAPRGSSLTTIPWCGVGRPAGGNTRLVSWGRGGGGGAVLSVVPCVSASLLASLAQGRHWQVGHLDGWRCVLYYSRGQHSPKVPSEV